MSGFRLFTTALNRMSRSIKEEKKLLRKRIKETLSKIEEQKVKEQCR